MWVAKTSLSPLFSPSSKKVWDTSPAVAALPDYLGACKLASAPRKSDHHKPIDTGLISAVLALEKRKQQLSAEKEQRIICPAKDTLPLQMCSLIP
jgi:hypothetical protein